MDLTRSIDLLILCIAAILVFIYWRKWTHRHQRKWPASSSQQEKIDFAMRVKRPAFFILAVAVLLVMGLDHMVHGPLLQ